MRTGATDFARPVSNVPARETLWTGEGIAGIYLNQVTAQVVRRAAGAFATCVFKQRAEPRPQIVVAHDGRALTAELYASVAEAVMWCGGDILELGQSYSADVARAVRHFSADGGLLVGNVMGQSHTASLSFYGALGTPWSLGGSLDAVKALDESGFKRPVRNAGKATRVSMEGIGKRRAGFNEMGRSGSPLKVVVDTASAVLLERLTAALPVGSELIQPQSLPLAMNSVDAKDLPRPSFRQVREKMIARQVVASGADLGIWIDGIGEVCSIFDSRGLAVPMEQLVRLLARCPFDEIDLAVENVAGATREQAYQEFEKLAAMIAGDGVGRIWFREAKDACLDALLPVLRLIDILEATGLPLRKLIPSA